MPACQAPSAALLAANARLARLREQHQKQRSSALPHQSSEMTDPKTVAAVRLAEWPSHLGWGSEALTAVLRQRKQQELNGVEDGEDWLARLANHFPSEPEATTGNVPFGNDPVPATNTQLTSPDVPQATGWIKLFPDIGLGMLRQGMSAPGRLWLMLRYLDQQGSGSLRIVNMVQTLTPKTSPLRMCGKRQLRNLLRDGEGVYWTRDKERIWLRSAAKVAYALGVERLTSRPVALPIAAVLDGIGMFRAHLYAAFHSGRTKETPHGTQMANSYSSPIARETLAGLSGVGQSSQRSYEARVGVKVQANFAMGEAAREKNRENRAWTQGQALFELKDYRGQQGQRGKSYLAWQLPNAYIGQHQKRPRGRQKRINRELKDLVMKGMPGNVGKTSETQELEKIYFPNGKLAAKVHGRDQERELYWLRHRTENGRFDLWQQWGDR